MAAPKRPTHEVIHRSLYLRVDGKLQEMEFGSHLTLSDKQAEGMVAKKFIRSLKEAKAVAVDVPDESADDKQ